MSFLRSLFFDSMKSSWQTTSPGFGYGMCRTYGGVRFPPGGRRLKDKWIKASRAFKRIEDEVHHRPASLLTKQQANDRLKFGPTVMQKKQAQEAKPTFGPRVPGCHLVSRQRLLNLDVNVKQDVKMEHVSVKQEEMEHVSVKQFDWLSDHQEDMDSFIILDSVFKNRAFPIWQK